MNDVTEPVESTGEHDAALDDTQDTLTGAIDYLRLVCGARRQHRSRQIHQQPDRGRAQISSK